MKFSSHHPTTIFSSGKQKMMPIGRKPHWEYSPIQASIRRSGVYTRPLLDYLQKFGVRLYRIAV
jgi:hypothetical protein